ncbi:MAG: hypothetical protein HC945_03310 [Nitrosarchaeum sp.]|nr:hypothetical protein [Nitrosarchaeum sp.]
MNTKKTLWGAATLIFALGLLSWVFMTVIPESGFGIYAMAALIGIVIALFLALKELIQGLRG